jgi:hypothetical protein
MRYPKSIIFSFPRPLPELSFFVLSYFTTSACIRSTFLRSGVEFAANKFSFLKQAEVNCKFTGVFFSEKKVALLLLICAKKTLQDPVSTIHKTKKNFSLLILVGLFVNKRNRTNRQNCQ